MLDSNGLSFFQSSLIFIFAFILAGEGAMILISLTTFILRLIRKTKCNYNNSITQDMLPARHSTINETEPQQQDAFDLATNFYDLVEKILEVKEDINAPNDHGPFKIGAENVKIGYYGPGASRGLFWNQNGVDCKMWFECKGWVHYYQENNCIYRQVIWSKHLCERRRYCEDEYYGNISQFMLHGNYLFNIISRENAKDKEKKGDKEPTKAPQSWIGQIFSMLGEIGKFFGK
jgi:hypothetical protein